MSIPRNTVFKTSVFTNCQILAMHSSNLGEEQGNASPFKTNRNRECLGKRMSPPTKEAIPEISSLIISAGEAPPGFSSFCSAHRPAFLFASMNSQKSKGKKQRGFFFIRSAEITHKRRMLGLKYARTLCKWAMQVKFQGLGEYSPTQISLAKTGHMVPPNLMRLGNVVFLCIQKGEENQIWVAQVSLPQVLKLLIISVF